MHVNACQIVSTVNADGADGFELTVTRWIGHDHPIEQPPKDAIPVSKGPFYFIKGAIQYAQSWNDATKPPAIAPHEPLLINGCQLTAIAHDNAKDGYVSYVIRTFEDKEIKQGPFDSVKSAIEYAKEWTDPEHPPAMPKSELTLHAEPTEETEQQP